MDPKLAHKWMEDGTLPNLAQMAKTGAYQDLPTTNPAQSPVAWSSFATGLHPGDHGIFDFLMRRPDTYEIESAVATELFPPTLRLFRLRLPLGDPVTLNRRSGTPFWISLERQGYRASVIGVPVTYPPDPVQRIISGMGVPDLLGTQGTYTLYTANANESLQSDGGRIVRIKPENGTAETVLEGPPNPVLEDSEPLTVPLVLSDDGNRSRVVLDGHQVTLTTGQWSDWVPVVFRFLGFGKIHGIVRLCFVQGFPEPKLYVTPIQIDPSNPAVPIAWPVGFSRELAERIGPYYTAGMPEETKSINENRIDDHMYLETIRLTLREREAMFFDTLDRRDSNVVVTVFVQTDRVSHLFWRGIDPLHARYKDASPEARSAIHWIYREADRIVGKTLAEMGPRDRLIVLSDHGFGPFRRAVHLNRWLANAGFLKIRPEDLSVDWSQTQAYAMGLNGIFLNLRGREAKGTVDPVEAKQLKNRIKADLTAFRDPVGGTQVISAVMDSSNIYHGVHSRDAPDLTIGYALGYRASWETGLGTVSPTTKEVIEENSEKWSGDHANEPSLVPGVLFTSFRPSRPLESIVEVSSLVREALGQSLDGKGSRYTMPIPHMPTLWKGLAYIASLRTTFPIAVQLIALSFLTAAISMALYALLMDRERLRALRAAGANARRELVTYDGPLGGLFLIIGRNYSLTGRQLWTIFLPACAAGLPAGFMLIGVATVYDHTLPKPQDVIAVEVVPAKGHREPITYWRGTLAKQMGERWLVPWPSPGNTVQLVNHDGFVLISLPTSLPVTEVTRRSWWSDLVSPSVGYLPEQGDVETIRLDMPISPVLDVGPWQQPASVNFLVLLVLFTLLLKLKLRF
jgi:predicted AlkP superfamily phosphohydrolase/phosphomutase